MSCSNTSGIAASRPQSTIRSPIHLQPAARDLGHKKGDFPATERQADRILTLPVNQYMSEADVEAVASEVLAFLGR